VTLAQAGKLPQLVYAWSPAGSDEHPPSKSDAEYIKRGHDFVWQRIDAVVKAGQWENTVFILTWVPDDLHPSGFQVLGGSRLPLVMFGGGVLQGIDNRWHSHASIPKTIIDLFGLEPFGVPRVDTAPSLAARVSSTAHGPKPPAFGTPIVQPKAPIPTPHPVPPPAWSGPLKQVMPKLVANHGKTLNPPTDGVVEPHPPKPPKASA
jgi:hypothetical protein